MNLNSKSMMSTRTSKNTHRYGGLARLGIGAPPGPTPRPFGVHQMVSIQQRYQYGVKLREDTQAEIIAAEIKIRRPDK